VHPEHPHRIAEVQATTQHARLETGFTGKREDSSMCERAAQGPHFLHDADTVVRDVPQADQQVEEQDGEGHADGDFRTHEPNGEQPHNAAHSMLSLSYKRPAAALRVRTRAGVFQEVSVDGRSGLVLSLRRLAMTPCLWVLADEVSCRAWATQCPRRRSAVRPEAAGSPVKIFRGRIGSPVV